MTEKEKQDAIDATITLLNGDNEAIEYARQIKEDVYKTGDKELIKTIEHLWKII